MVLAAKEDSPHVEVHLKTAYGQVVQDKVTRLIPNSVEKLTLSPDGKTVKSVYKGHTPKGRICGHSVCYYRSYHYFWSE